MLQIFLQTSKINALEWQTAYQKIKSIVENFPIKIIRLESYYGYEKKLDKKHFDLVLDRNTAKEHISFWGDWMSYTGSQTIRFYKDWSKQQVNQVHGNEIDKSKSIVWYPNIPYKNDGDIPSANGILPFTSPLVETEGTHYEAVLIAIGILLENMFPEKAFLTLLWGRNEQDIKAVLEWLTHHFKRIFYTPLYFDKKRLLKLLKKDYNNDKDIICRLAHLYRKKHWENMEFAINNIGYEPTFEFYTEILADTGFGTFGFEDVLNPWIAATQDLEATLDLVTASKKYLLKRENDKYNMEQAAKYDFSYILKQLLNSYILWTPIQREKLEHFYTNKKALKEGSEDLFGVMRRMMGYRIDICPFYANQEELFEAFMYHDPKNGNVYKKMIEKWITDNVEKYEDLKSELEQAIAKQEQSQNAYLEEREKLQVTQQDERDILISRFLENFLPYERYFVEKAVRANPLFLNVEEAINDLKTDIVKTIEEYRDKEYLQELKMLSKETHIKFIKSRIRDIGYTVHPSFEKWLSDVQDKNILFYLHILMALKIYSRDTHFVRFRLLWDKRYWKRWIT